MIWQNMVNALIGIWLIIAPFTLSFTGEAAQMWTSIVGGVLLLVLAGSAALNAKARRQAWIQYVNGLVGIWFILAPWVLSFTARSSEFRTSLVAGIIVLVLSARLAFGEMPKAAATH